jgi:hypothetical protein
MVRCDQSKRKRPQRHATGVMLERSIKRPPERSLRQLLENHRMGHHSEELADISVGADLDPP